MNVELILFWIFAICTVASTVLVLVARSPISSAISLVGTFFFLAGIYVLLFAHTLAVLQVLVYAGAVMVLFLFVIMLLSLDETGPRSSITISRLLGAAATAVLLVYLGRVLVNVKGQNQIMSAETLSTFGTLGKIGEILYTRWLFPFEAVSLLLLVAIVGAVVVAKPRI